MSTAATDPLWTLRRLLRAMHTPGLKINPTGIFVLAQVAKRGPIHTTDLNWQCFGERRLVHNHLYQLEDAGYIVWSRQRIRGAAGIVEVTAKGLELMTALGRVMEGRAA